MWMVAGAMWRNKFLAEGGRAQWLCTCAPVAAKALLMVLVVLVESGHGGGGGGGWSCSATTGCCAVHLLGREAVDGSNRPNW